MKSRTPRSRTFKSSPKGNIEHRCSPLLWERVSAFSGEFRRLGRFTAHCKRQGRTPQPARTLTITGQRIGTRVGLLEVLSDVSKPLPRCRLRSALILLTGFSSPPMEVLRLG